MWLFSSVQRPLHGPCAQMLIRMNKSRWLIKWIHSCERLCTSLKRHDVWVASPPLYQLSWAEQAVENSDGQVTVINILWTRLALTSLLGPFGNSFYPPRCIDALFGVRIPFQSQVQSPECSPPVQSPVHLYKGHRTAEGTAEILLGKIR